VSVWIPEGDSPKRVFEKPVSLLCAAWSPDSKYLAAGAQDASVYFWIWKSGRDLQMGGYPTKVRPPAWDRTSRFLATGGSAWALVWDCSGKGPEGTRPLMLEGHAEDKLVTALTYQKKGDILASGGADGKIILWQPITSQRPVTQLQLNAGISALTWSPDERLLLAGTETGSLFVYSV
jgi:WD40 repeat protein